MSLSRALQFSTERFDYRSELPEEANAGNRFYGRDVAEFIAQGLSARGITAGFIDEDWGWLVQPATREAAQPFEIAIYNLSDHGEGGRPGVPAWGLWIRAYERKKVLGLFGKLAECTVPEPLVQAVTAVFGAAGVALTPWDDGPQGRDGA